MNLGYSLDGGGGVKLHVHWSNIVQPSHARLYVIYTVKITEYKGENVEIANAIQKNRSNSNISAPETSSIVPSRKPSHKLSIPKMAIFR